jgi:CBS domain containing-hemolysin-like protein
VRELLPIYWKVSLEDALADMRSAEKHVARAFDEQGATRGVLFFEDAVEVLVGKVEDVTADSLKPDRGRPGFLSGVHPHLPPDDRQI